MEKNNETEYERLEAPYETIDETRKELFETIDWKKAVAQLFDIFSDLWKDSNRIFDVTNDWELEQAIRMFAKTLTVNFDDNYQTITAEALLLKMKYFKAEFANREVEKLNLTSIEWFSQLLDIYTMIEKQWLMRAKLHAKLMMWLTEEELDEIEKENMLLEEFLEKEKMNMTVAKAYAQEINEIFSSTWGVEFWIWKSRESLKTLWFADPTDKEVIELAEYAFNGYLKDIFWIELRPLHFVAKDEDVEDVIKKELWFAKLYEYILKNQLPN